MRKWSWVPLVAGATAAALLPLYGDPKAAGIVSHPEWARMVVRGLELLVDAPGVHETAAQVFATLSGRESRSYPAEAYVRAKQVDLVESPPRRLRPRAGIGEAVYSMAIARAGDYRLRLRLAGGSTAEAELTKAGDHAVLRRFSLGVPPELAWVDAGFVHLEPGAYETTVLLPEDCALAHVELAPPCVHPIEPREGWKASAVTTTDDVAVTVLRALNLESELPPAGAALEFRGGELRSHDGAQAVEATVGGGFRSGPRGARVFLSVDVPRSGLYTLYAFGVRFGGERWLVDGCQSSLVCPTSDPAPAWHVVMSGVFLEGHHVFAASLGPDTLIERLRLEPKKDAPADYLATLERLGLELGAPGPVTREKAEEARRFLSRRRALLADEACLDIIRAGTLVAELAASGPAGSASGGGGGEQGGPAGPEGGPGVGPGGPGGGPPPPPIIPPLPPPSPTLPFGYGGD